MANHEKCRCSRECCTKLLRQNKLLVATAVGVLVGVILGGVLRLCHLSQEAHLWLEIWGDLFIRMLKLIILPLIISCLITAISAIEGKAGGRLGILTLVYIFSTHFVSVTVAAIFSLLIQPGRKWEAVEKGSQMEVDITSEHSNSTYPELTNNTQRGNSERNNHQVNYNDLVADFLRNLFPDNIIRACLQNVYTERTYIQTVNEHGQNVTDSVTDLLYRDGTNMIGIVLFSVTIGFAISAAGEEGKPLLSVFKSLSKVIFLVMNVIFWYSPFAIASLIASAIVKIQDLNTVLTSIGLYVTTVLLCCVLHQFVLLPLMYLVFTRRNPFVYYFHIFDGLLTGFAASSSVAGLPVLLNACKNKLGINSKVADFVLPVAVTINRDGSVMFVVVTTFFVAQSAGIVIAPGQIVLICVLTSLLAPTMAAVPSSSLVLLITFTSSLNIPLGDRLAVVMALEWLQDRVRTTNNLASSAYGCAVIDRFCNKYISYEDVLTKDSSSDACLKECSL